MHYRQVGAIRSGYKVGKAWILLEALRELRLQRLWNPSDLTLASGCGSLQNMAGAKVSNGFGSFLDKSTSKN